MVFRLDLLEELAETLDHRGRIFEETGGQEGVVVELLGHEDGFAFVGVLDLGELLDDRVAGIEFEVHLNRRGFGVITFGLHRLHHLAHLGRHELVGVEHCGGRIDEAIGGFYFGYLLTEGFLEPLDEGVEFVFFEGFTFGFVIAEFEVSRISGGQVLAVELAQVTHHVVVHVFEAVDDLKVAGFQAFEIRTAFDGVTARADEEVDFLLFLAHA